MAARRSSRPTPDDDRRLIAASATATPAGKVTPASFTTAGPTGTISSNTLSVSIPIRPRSLNRERNLHYHARSTSVQQERGFAKLAAFEAMKAAGFLRTTGPLFRCVKVDAWPSALNRRYRQDIGNCYPSVKACIDGLVDARVIEDDDDRFIEELTFHPIRFGVDQLILVVREVA